MHHSSSDVPLECEVAVVKVTPARPVERVGIAQCIDSARRAINSAWQSYDRIKLSIKRGAVDARVGIGGA